MPLFCYRVVGKEQGSFWLTSHDHDILFCNSCCSANFDALAEYIILQLHSIM